MDEKIVVTHHGSRDQVSVAATIFGGYWIVDIQGYKFEMSGPEWSGRQTLSEAVSGIDKMIAMLQRAKEEIAKLQAE